jgi:Ca2+-binding RTX toxin-like protein
MAKRTSAKSKSTLAGTNAADVLTVKHSQVTVKAGKGNDKINVNNGSSHKIYGETGNDTIIVAAKAGSSSKVYGDDAKNKLTGRDTFTINGGKKNYFYGGKGVDTFNVNGGSTNYIYGGAGNDVIVIGKTSTGTVVVKDFSVKSGNKDTVKVTGGAVKSIAVSGKNMIAKGGKSASVTLQNAKSKTFTVTDTLGNYTVAGANIKLALGKNYKGTLNTASFITTVDGRSDANAFTINGNAKNNTIYGGAGNNTLNGGAGNDTLTGGAGKDVFKYANGQGKDTIRDYAAGQDTLQITGGSISKAALANSNKDLVFTVGNGSITLKNAAAKAISLKDSRGNYTASSTTITLGSNFNGTMDSAKYLSTVTTINGKSSANTVTLKGNAKANTIYGGSGANTIYGYAGDDKLYGYGGNDALDGGAGNDTLNGGIGNDTLTSGAGNDTLNGGTGSDTYVISSAFSSDTMISINQTEFTAGDADVLYLQTLNHNAVSYSLAEGTLTITDNNTGGRVIVAGWDVNPLTSIQFADNKSISSEMVNEIISGVSYVIPISEDGIYTSEHVRNTFAFSGSGWSVAIQGAGSYDTLDFSSYRDGRYVFSSNYKAFDTLYLTFSQFDEDGSTTDVGTVYLMDYFAAEEKPGKVLLYDNAVGEVRSYSMLADSNGGAGDDLIFKNTEDNDLANVLNSGAGDDVIYGSRGSDTLNGGTGNDTLYGGTGNDTLNGGAGDDLLYGQDGNNTLNGDAGNDILYGGDGNGTLNGGAGDDILYGGEYPDTFIYVAGEGNDIIKNFNNNGQPDTLQITNGFIKKAEFVGNDAVFTTDSGSVTLEGAKGQTINIIDGCGTHVVTEDTITVYDDYTGKMDANVYFDTVKTISVANQAKGVTVIGNALDNVINGGNNDDTLYGGAGNDTLYGGNGNDTLYGSAGNDTLSGGKGNDTFVFDKDYTGNNTISDFEVGKDFVRFADDMHVTGSSLDTGAGYSVALELSTDGIVNVASAYGKTIAFKDYNDGDFAVVIGTFDNDDPLTGTSGDDILYGLSGADTLIGNAGNDTLYGGFGNDTFVYGAGEGNDVIKDYTQNEDTVKITNGFVSQTNTDGGNLVFTAGGGTVTLEGATDKTISMTDTNGSYTVSAEAITLGSDYSGVLDSNAYLSTVVTIDGSSAAGGLGITGNSQNNVITGGAGNDMLTGGAGKDTFVYTGGVDIVTDYTAGQDTLQVSDGYFSGMAVDNNNKDVVFTVDGGSVTLLDAVNKELSLKDKNGSFTVSGSAIALGSDFTGSLDADKFSADTIYVGDCKESVLTGGQGADNFIFVNPTGNHMITDYEHGTDVLRFETDLVTGSAVSGTDVVLTLSGGATVTIQNQAAHAVTFTDATNREISVNPRITQQSVIKSLMKALDDYPTAILSEQTVRDALGAAVNYASNGVFTTWDSLIKQFVGDVRNYGGSSSDILNHNVIEGSTLDNFLINYCGINLHNEDTGAINGADAGGAEVKTAVSIVPESGNIGDLVPVTTDTATIKGLTFHWEESVCPNLDTSDADPKVNFVSWFANEGTDSEKQTAILDRINTWWAEEGLNLVEGSYGLSFTEEGTTVNDIDVKFYNDNSDTLASVRWAKYKDGPQQGESIELRLQINMHHFENFDFEDVNGRYPIEGSDEYFNLDRILAHELTHAAMAANITGFSNLPEYFKEGSAELVHGIDDFRAYSIAELARTVKADFLEQYLFNHDVVLSEEDKKYYYSGGYMLLRYLAKQSADYYDGTPSSTVTDSGAGILNKASVQNALLDFADPFVSDSFSGFRQDESKNESLFVTGNV